MGILSLNGNFSYPIELLKTLTVDDETFLKSSVSQGSGSADGLYAIATGESTVAAGSFSHAEGFSTESRGKYSHAEGEYSKSVGDASHTDGYMAYANGDYSYVWQGSTSNDEYTDSHIDYESEDSTTSVLYSGSFNINPKAPETHSSSPEYGFFIGETSFPLHIKSYSREFILKAENEFTDINTFKNTVNTNGAVNVKGTLNTVEGSTSIFNGELQVVTKGINEEVGRYAASTEFTQSLILSGLNNVGNTDITKDVPDSRAASFGYLKNYISDAFNNSSKYVISTKPLDSVANRDFVISTATSAAYFAFSNDNTFTGTNTFKNDVTIYNTTLTLNNASTLDASNCTVRIKNPSIDSNDNYVPATTNFSRSIATSGVDYIHKSDNVFSGNNTFNGETVFSNILNVNYTANFNSNIIIKKSNVSLDYQSTLNLSNATVKISNPSIYTNRGDIIASTEFSRSIGTSGVYHILNNSNSYYGDNIYNGSITARGNVNLGSNAVATTQSVYDNSTKVSTTALVDEKITKSLSTSSGSVKKLILDTDNSFTATIKFKDNVYFNDDTEFKSTTLFPGSTKDSSFTGSEVYVKTQEYGTNNDTAASTKFVNTAISKISARPFDMFDIKWSDYYPIGNASWRLAGSWVTNASAVSCMSHILNDYRNGITKTDTYNFGGIENTSITYNLASDGHKIVLYSMSNMSILNKLYESYGADWYYVINTTDYSFRLPRTKVGFSGFDSYTDTSIRPGDYQKPGLPDITGSFQAVNSTCDGAFKDSSTGCLLHHTDGKGRYLNFAASYSNSIYGSSKLVVPAATKLYLYFYCY